jgi:hypothetical protein
VDDTEFVDALTLFWENVGSAETSDDASVQARNTFFAQQAVSQFWHFRPWPWKQRVKSDVLVADGQGDLPDDFGTFGQQGGVFILGTGIELRWVPAQTLHRIWETQQVTAGQPIIYTVTGLATMAVGTPLIRVYPVSNATLVAYYDAKAPTVDYATPEALEQIPVQYHETVLFDLACSKLAFGEGDPRSGELRQQAMRGMAEAWAEERPGVNQPRRGPAYGRVYAGGLR